MKTYTLNYVYRLMCGVKQAVLPHLLSVSETMNGMRLERATAIEDSEAYAIHRWL